jgi:hypothetical protein
VLEAVFVLLEPPSPSRRIFIGSHSLPPSLVRRIGPSKRIMGIKTEASPYTRVAKVYAIESEEEEKTTAHLSCEINGVQCKALCDIRAQVSVISSKIYGKVQNHNLDLAPTSTKLIMGDGRTIRPLGIACNMNVIISGKCIPTDSLLLMLTIVIMIT